MAYAVVRTDLYGGAMQPSELVSLRYYNGEALAPVENGTVVKLEGYEKGEREVWKAKAASSTDDPFDCAIVTGVEVMYDETKKNLDAYTNETGKIVRGFIPVNRNIFSATKEAFEGAAVPEVGQTVGIGTNGKLKSGSTGLGKCIAVDKVGRYTYYSIRISLAQAKSAPQPPPPPEETGADRVSVADQAKTYSTLGNKKVSELISSNVKINWAGTTGTVSGDILNISDHWKEFDADDSNNTGHFFPIDLDGKYSGEKITVIGKRQKTVQDLEWVLRVENAKSNKFTFKKGSDTLFTLDFSSATLVPPELNIKMSKLDAANAPQDSNVDQCKANQNAISSVVKSGNQFTVSGDLKTMQEYTSTNPGQKDKAHKWFALIVDTGESDITKVTCNDQKLTVTDVAEASSVSAKAGSFVLWLKADELTTATLVLKAAGKADTTVTITFTDTGAV